MYLQDTDAAVGAIFGPVLNAVPAAFYFFSLCLLQRSPSLGARMREKAGQRIAAKLGEAMPAWVMTDILALHLYACRLGGVAVHKMVKSVRAIGDDAFYEEVAEAVGALLQGEMLVFAQYGSAALPFQAPFQRRSSGAAARRQKRLRGAGRRPEAWLERRRRRAPNHPWVPADGFQPPLPPCSAARPPNRFVGYRTCKSCNLE